MATLSIDEIDKSNFKCFLLPDNSYYFGEVAWVDQSGQIVDSSVIDDYHKRFSKQEEFLLHQKEEEEKAKTLKSKPVPKKGEQENTEKTIDLLPPNLYKRIRHGFGIQIFQKIQEFVVRDEAGVGVESVVGVGIESGVGVESEFVAEEDKKEEKNIESHATPSFLCKYEGWWDRDRKNGEGKCFFPDGSCYLGEMKEDVMDGYGQFLWANGDSYHGNWKNGRFEGGGKFVHRDGNQLQGLFKNNYFNRNGQLYINPMMSSDELNSYLELWKKSDKIKESNFNKKLFNYALVSTYEKIVENINNSIKNKRIPLILSSKQLAISKEEMLYKLSTYLNKTYSEKHNEFNLRFAYKLLKEDPLKKNSLKEYMDNIKLILSNAIYKGGMFIINIDDCERINYENNYDPDIRQFYSSFNFPSQIWNLDKFYKPEVYEKVCAGTEIKLIGKVSGEFYPLVWSKYRIDQDLDREKVLDRFRARFSNIIPIEKCDLILLKEEIEHQKSEEKIETIDTAAENDPKKISKKK